MRMAWTYWATTMMMTPFVLGGQLLARECSVTLRVVDHFGKPADYRLAWFRDRSGRDYTERFEGLHGRIPCGYEVYKYQVSRTDRDHVLGKLEGELIAGKPETWKTVVTNPNVRVNRFGIGEVSKSLPHDYMWKGLVKPKVKGPLWVHIRSVVGPEHVEAAVDTSGEFKVYEGFSNGNYVLYVSDNSGSIRYTRVLNITTFAPSVPLIIELPDEAPTVTVVK